MADAALTPGSTPGAPRAGRLAGAPGAKPARPTRRGWGRWAGLLLLPLVVAMAVHAQAPAAADAATALGPPLWAYWVLLVALIGGSGTISACETAIFSLDKLDLNQMRNQPTWTHRIILRLLDNANESLVTMMIFNNVVNIGTALTASALTARLAGGRGEWYVIPAATALAGGGIMLFGEIVPKMLAHANPQGFSRVLAPFLLLIDIVFSPLRMVFNVVLHVIFRLLGIHDRPGAAEVSEEELKVMINSGEVSQVLEQDEREMIDGVFELRRTIVSEILTPRMAVATVSADLDQEQMLARLRELTVSRVLVVRESLDHLEGFLLVKEVLLNPLQPWRDHLREPMLVPEGVGLLDVLGQFRRQRTKMAVVVDEYGGTAGIITLQDVLEEIVGDMYERHEVASKDMSALGPGRWRAVGSILLDELAEELHVAFPEQKGRTLGGFIMNTLGRIPKAGDEVIHESLLLRVETMVARRVSSVEIEEVTGAAAAPEGASATAAEGGEAGS